MYRVNPCVCVSGVHPNVITMRIIISDRRHVDTWMPLPECVLIDPRVRVRVDL